MSSKSKDITKRCSTLSRFTVWLDGYAEFHLVDPARIERLLNSGSWPDLDQLWSSVKSDVSTITDLPAGSKKVKKFSRISSYARLASLIMVVVSFAFIEIYFFQSGVKKYINPAAALGSVIVILYVSLMVNVIASKRMNAAIRDMFQEHALELTKNRNRIRQSAQAVIDKLQREVTSHDLDPERFKFDVFYEKYNNTSIIGQRGSRHTVIVRARKKTK